MNRGEMRAMLKDCLQEPSGTATDQFSIPQLNMLLNRGLLWVATMVQRVNPDAVLAIDTFALAANKNLYPVPTGCVAVRKVVRTRDGKRLARRSDAYLDATYGAVTGESVTTGTTLARDPLEWAQFGRFIRLGPTPNEALANGIRITYIPSLTMSDDADVPQLVEGLHDAVVNRAWQLGLRPNADIAQKAAAAKAVEDSILMLPELVGTPTDDAMQLIPDFDGVSGLYGTTTDTDSETR